MFTIKKTEEQQEPQNNDTLPFSSRYFAFPTTVYLSDDVSRTNELEEMGVTAVPEGASGVARCLPEDILTWYDSFSRPRTIEDVKQNGFDITHIVLKGGEQFQCNWDRKTFEKRLDAHVQKVEQYDRLNMEEQFKKAVEQMQREQEIEKEIERDILEDTKSKKSWWKIW